MADYPVATPEQIAEAQRLAAAAEAANQAWRNNTAPVLPKMGTPYGVSQAEQQDLTRIYIGGDANTQGVARDVTRSEYIQMFGRTPEQSEAAKYYSFNAPIDYAAYANVPLSQLPENIASRVQDYFAAHPTARFQAITQQYAATRGGSRVNPYDPNSALGIAWEVSRVTGGEGQVTESLREKAIAETQMTPFGGIGYSASDRLRGEKMVAGLATVTGMETIPVRNPFVDVTIAPGRNVYVPIGEHAQQLRTDTKLVFSGTGAYEVWQTPKNTMPGSDFIRIYPMITAGGSDYALASGMITGKPATPQVYSEYGLQPLWKESTAARVADIQAHPEQYSRLGSELYGGIVQKLLPPPYGTIEVAWARGQTVEPGVYPAVRENYASLINFADVNAPKGTVSSGANLPKFGAISPQQFAEMPAIQRVDLQGGLSPAVMKEKPADVPYRSVSRDDGRLVGSKMVGGEPTYGTTDIVASELPRPYISASTGVIAPTGEISVDIYGNKATLIPAGIWGVSDVIKFFQPQQRVTTTMTGETVLPEETRLVKTETTPLKEVSSYLGFTQKEVPGGIETTKYYEKTGGSETISTYEKTGGIQREFATTVAPIPKSSGLDIFEQTVRETLRLPSVEVGEKIAKTAQWANPYVMPSLVAGETQKAITGFAFGKESEQAKQAEITAESMYALAPASLKGQYEMFYEHPTMSALSYGAGGAIGTVAKAGEGLYMAGRAGIAERAISQGGVWRAAEQVTGTVMGRAPQVLAAMYSVDIAGRATEGFTDLSPATAVPKARALLVQEAYPMMAGFEAPSSAIRTVKTAEIGYKAALQEGTAGGRLEYYVTQPATKPYQLAKQDYAAYLQENAPTLTPRQKIIRDVMEIQKYDIFASDTMKAYWGGGTLAGEQAFATTGSRLGFEPSIMTRAQMAEVLPTEPGLVSYAQYKAERAVRSAAMPFQAFVQEAPGKITSAVSAAKTVPSKVVGIFDQPYAVESTRGYYPYAGIEKAAYPKTTGMKLPTTQDILITGYSGYYGARATAIEKARGIGTALKGGAERAAAVVSGEPGVSVGVKPEPLGETLLNVFYTPRLGKVLPPSTFGETKPIGGFITTTIGGAGAEASGKPAGKPAAPAPFRKTPYGTGLAKEPSLKSMGISERAAPAGKSTLRGEQVTDFRGKPVSERMKPMERGSYGPQGAQAAGQPRLLMEELPKVEGMPQGRVTPQEMRFVSGAPSLQQRGRTGVVQVTEPSLAFTQERRQQQFAGVVPVVSVMPAAMVSTAFEPRTRQGVVQAARQAQITNVIPLFTQTTEARMTQAARQVATRDYTRDLITTPSFRTGFVTSITPFQAIDTRTSQETKRTQITETKPHTDTWKKPWVEPLVEKIPGGALWPGGAGGETPGRRPRRAAFMETFMMGLDVGFGMGGRRPRAKSFTTPKKYKTKPKATKKKGR